MSQVSTYSIPGSPLNMAALATALEAMFAAVASANRGPAAPQNPFPMMFWWDTAADPVETLKCYTTAYGWLTLLSVNTTTGVVLSLGGRTIGGTADNDIPTNSSAAAFSGKTFSDTVDIRDLVRLAPTASRHLADIGHPSGNLYIDARSGLGGGYLFLNLNAGDGGVIIGNGAGAPVVVIDSSGNAAFIGALEATSVTYTGLGTTIPRTKIVEIGDWNMDTTPSVTVAHGLDCWKIVGMRVLIRPDTVNPFAPAPLDYAGSYLINGLNADYISLSREEGGYFDGTYHNATSYNRGWIIIDYID